MECAKILDMRSYLRYSRICGARERGVEDYVEVKAEACIVVAGCKAAV